MDIVTLGAALKGAKTYTDATIAPLLGGVHYRGSVNYFNNLPSNPAEGDAYTVKYSGTSGTSPDGTEYVWALDTDDNTYKWIGFSPDTYTKSEIDALLAPIENNILLCYNLKGVTEIADNTDLNTLETAGNYYKTSSVSSVSNKPTEVDTSSPFRLNVVYFSSNGYRMQCYTEWKSGKKYSRIRNTEWSSWKLVEDDWQRIADLESFMAEKYPVAITTQPTSVSGAVGDTAVFTVVASGVGLSYQWYYKAPSSSEYLPVGFGDNTKTTLSVPITAARDGMTYACKVYDAANNIVMSDGAVLTVIE